MGKGHLGCPDKPACNVHAKLCHRTDSDSKLCFAGTPLVSTAFCTSSLTFAVPFAVQSPPDVVRFRGCLTQHASALQECKYSHHFRHCLTFKAAGVH